MAWRNTALEPYMNANGTAVREQFKEIVKFLIQAWTELDELQERHNALAKKMRADPPKSEYDTYMRPTNFGN